MNVGLGVNIRYITSDCEAVAIIHDRQGYAKTAEDAIADVLKAGIVGPLSFFIHIVSLFVYLLCHNHSY